MELKVVGSGKRKWRKAEEEVVQSGKLLVGEVVMMGSCTKNDVETNRRNKNLGHCACTLAFISCCLRLVSGRGWLNCFLLKPCCRLLIKQPSSRCSFTNIQAATVDNLTNNRQCFNCAIYFEAIPESSQAYIRHRQLSSAHHDSLQTRLMKSKGESTRLVLNTIKQVYRPMWRHTTNLINFRHHKYCFWCDLRWKYK